MISLIALLAAAPPNATAPAPAVPAPVAQVRGLDCTGDNREVRQIVIDFTGGRWRETGREWQKIAAQDDATITLVKQGGMLSDVTRLERLDRSTLELTAILRTGLINESRHFRCVIVPPFDAKPQL